MRLYLDHAATTPLSPIAKEAMLPWLDGGFGNPSSLHEDGRRAKDAIDQAREAVSERLGSLFAEVTFTSSGTEAANTAIFGTALANRDSCRSRILIGAAEHHCVLHCQPILERLGAKVELIPVRRDASVDIEKLRGMMDETVLLVSVMHANNEIGTINPVREIADIAHEWGAIYHCDAVQTYMNVPWKVSDLDADIVTISAHKVNGPKGVGALYLRAGIKIQPMAVGGGQEREMRAGTENVAAIAGFGAAVAARGDGASQRAVRDHFMSRLVANGFVPTNSDFDNVLNGHAHVRLPGFDAETMLIRLDRMGVSASSGAACSSGSIEPSHVLIACGYSEDESKEGLRFTFAHDAKLEEAEIAAQRVIETADAVREARRKK